VLAVTHQIAFTITVHICDCYRLSSEHRVTYRRLEGSVAITQEHGHGASTTETVVIVHHRQENERKACCPLVHSRANIAYRYSREGSEGDKKVESSRRRAAIFD